MLQWDGRWKVSRRGQESTEYRVRVRSTRHRLHWQDLQRGVLEAHPPSLHLRPAHTPPCPQSPVRCLASLTQAQMSVFLLHPLPLHVQPAFSWTWNKKGTWTTHTKTPRRLCFQASSLPYSHCSALSILRLLETNTSTRFLGLTLASLAGYPPRAASSGSLVTQKVP